MRLWEVDLEIDDHREDGSGGWTATVFAVGPDDSTSMIQELKEQILKRGMYLFFDKYVPEPEEIRVIRIALASRVHYIDATIAKQNGKSLTRPISAENTRSLKR